MFGALKILLLLIKWCYDRDFDVVIDLCDMFSKINTPLTRIFTILLQADMYCRKHFFNNNEDKPTNEELEKIIVHLNEIDLLCRLAKVDKVKLLDISCFKLGLLSVMYLALDKPQIAINLAKQATYIINEQMELQKNYLSVLQAVNIEWPTLVHYSTANQEMLNISMNILHAVVIKFNNFETLRNVYERICYGNIIYDLPQNLHPHNIPTINLPQTTNVSQLATPQQVLQAQFTSQLSPLQYILEVDSAATQATVLPLSPQSNTCQKEYVFVPVTMPNKPYCNNSGKEKKRQNTVVGKNNLQVNTYTQTQPLESMKQKYYEVNDAQDTNTSLQNEIPDSQIYELPISYEQDFDIYMDDWLKYE